MANILERAITTVPNNGFARAKKLADLAIKTNVNGAGSPTSAGYEQAIGLLQPYISGGTETQSIDAQRLVAQYSNSLTKLQKKDRDQNETVSTFKMQEQDAYFTQADGDYGSFRNPGDLVSASSQALDNIVLGVMNAIDEKNASGDSTDALEGYLKEISQRADMMRDLDTRFQRGELGQGQMLDGFGYYIDTNPLDGSIRGAAVLPVSMLPDKIAENYKRLEATTQLGNGLLPVYTTAVKDQYGNFTAKIGDASWSGNSSDGSLRKKGSSSSDYMFRPGGFSLADMTKFSLNTIKVANGSFASGLVGRDADGNPVEGIFYRGADSKLYRVDSSTFEAFKNDPILSQKINQYMPRLSPSEAQGLLKESVQMPADRISFESKITGLNNEAATAQAEADRLQNLGFFGQLKEGFKIMGEQSRARQAERQASFFANRNAPNQPDQTQNVGANTPDIVEQGKSFFRKVGNWFSGK